MEEALPPHPVLSARRNLRARLALWLLLALAAGCGAPPTPVEVETAVKAGLGLAREACAAKDAKAAEKGARHAEEALRSAEARAGRRRAGLRAKQPSDSADLQEALELVERVKPLAREARRWADLAAEEKGCAAAAVSLKASAYRTARKGAVLAIFQGLALAAEQAGKRKPEELPQQIRGAARQASDMAIEFASRQPLPDGSPDWPGIAADMRGFSRAPPVDLGLAVAAGLIFTRQPGLALLELDAIPAEGLGSAERRIVLGCLRGLAYRLNACPRLAAREFDLLQGSDGAGLGQSTGPEIEAGLCALVAAYHFSERNLREADQWFMRAGQAWPGNPMMVFLTGEQLAANGEWERAADSLEARAEDEEDKWVAEVVARRARQNRDRRGEAPPLIMDPGFLWDLCWGYLNHCAEQAESARKLRGKMEAGRGLARELLSKLPGVGGE